MSDQRQELRREQDETSQDSSRWGTDSSSHHRSHKGPLHQETEDVGFSYKYDHFQDYSNESIYPVRMRVGVRQSARSSAEKRYSDRRNINSQRDGDSETTSGSFHRHDDSQGDTSIQYGNIHYQTRFPGERNGDDIGESWVVRRTKYNDNNDNNNSSSARDETNLGYHSQYPGVGESWAARQNNTAAEKNAQAAEILLDHIQNLYGSKQKNQTEFKHREKPTPEKRTTHLHNDDQHSVEYRDEQITERNDPPADSRSSKSSTPRSTVHHEAELKNM